MYKHFDLVKAAEKSHVLTVWRTVTGEGGDYGRLSTPIPSISEMQIRQNEWMKKNIAEELMLLMKTFEDKATNSKMKN